MSWPLPPVAPSSYPSGVPVSDPLYSMSWWQPTIYRLIAAEFPRLDNPAGRAFAMKWGEIESGGNPCAVGNPGQIEPSNGQPAEIGLGQLYNPDNFRTLHRDPAAFRAYAPEAAPIAASYRQAKADLDTARKAGAGNDDPRVVDAKHRMAVAATQIQSRTRDLTPAELDDNARWTLLAEIYLCIATADHAVATYSLSHWSVPDYYKLVKAPHALPAILNNGMPAVVKKLGRSPSSWAEFRQVLGMDQNDQWKRALDACETCGNATAATVA
jgi:hypothetical protein